MKRLATTSLILLVVLTSVLVGVQSAITAQSSDEKTKNVMQQTGLLLEVYNTIQNDYVDADQVQGDQLVRAAITRIVKSVDPRGYYFTPEQVERLAHLDDSLTAQAGLIIDSTASHILVITPLKHTGPWSEGVLPGDLITRINEQPLNEITLHEVYLLFQGEAGTTFDVETWREWRDPENRERVTITLERGTELPEPVSYKSIALQATQAGRAAYDFGYIQITRTNSNTGQQVADALRDLIAQGARDGFILDLRYTAYGNNLDGVGIADAFLNKGQTITWLHDKLKGERKEFKSEMEALTSAPMVVLVSEGTSGPAEVIAGALQDYSRAVILGPAGTRTAGHAVETSIVPLNHGGALRLTTSEYMTPSEKVIQGRGIVPDQFIDVERQQRREMLQGGYFAVSREEARIKAEEKAEAEAETEPGDPAVPDPVDVEDVFSDEEPVDIVAVESRKYDAQYQRAIELLTSAQIFARARALENE